MYKIVNKQNLNPTVTLMDIQAPYVAAKAEAGQFIILRVDADGERIPLTVAGYDREKGTVRIIFQIVGATTEKLNHLNASSLSKASIISASPASMVGEFTSSPYFTYVTTLPPRWLIP